MHCISEAFSLRLWSLLRSHGDNVAVITWSKYRIVYCNSCLCSRDSSSARRERPPWSFSGFCEKSFGDFYHPPFVPVGHECPMVMLHVPLSIHPVTDMITDSTDLHKICVTYFTQVIVPARADVQGEEWEFTWLQVDDWKICYLR